MQRRHFCKSLIAIGVCSCWVESPLFASETCVQVAPYLRRCTVSLASELVTVRALKRSSEWCWAACIEMIFRYYGHRVPQSRIIEETWGKITNMPELPDQILSALNRQWTDENGETFITTGDSFTANPATNVIDLRENRPVIIASLGRAMILTSLVSDINTVTGAWQVVLAGVQDPWPIEAEDDSKIEENSKRALTPQEWFSINFAARIVVMPSKNAT